MNAPMEKIDIPAWCFSRSARAYQGVKEVGKGKCACTNRVRLYATEELLTFLARQGRPFDPCRAPRQPASIAHNQGETPLCAASIARAALRNEPSPHRDNPTTAGGTAVNRRFPQGENDQHFWVFQRSSRVLEDHWEIPQPGNRLARLIESGFP